MRKKYYNQLKYMGLSRLSHCEGPNWDPVYVDPYWSTRPVTGNRAKFLTEALKKELWSMGFRAENTYSRPKFNKRRKYVISVVYHETDPVLWYEIRESRVN